MKNLPDFQANAFTFTDQFKMYRREGERKEKKEILVYVEEYLREVPLS
jgi:hypothetical protein